MSPKIKEESNRESPIDPEKSPKQDKPKAFTIKYKRPRGSRACTVCRSRKVRCDAEIHIPCTNCITFGCDCVLPEAKKRGNSSNDIKAKRKQPNAKPKTLDSDDEKMNQDPSLESDNLQNEPILNISQVSVPPSLTSNYKTRPSMHRKELLSSKNKASLTFVGSSSVALVTQRVGENHVQLTEDVFENSESSLDSVELEILKLRGAFLLPSNELALDLIDSYFDHVHPLMPVIDRTQFMHKFNDPNDNPSLMLLQAVLLCGCRVSLNPLLLDAKGSNGLAALTFFRRAKALYEASYESDPVSIIQTVILIGSYWDGPEDVTKNSFYWTRVGVGLAQGFGFQRDINPSQNMTQSEKKVWRRIWWCLFEKDRNVAIAFGRPSVIDLNDCDVPMLSIDDFNEDDPELGIKSPYPVNETEALYFIHLVKLAEITGIIIKHQYTVKSEQLKRKNKFTIIQHCDMLMGIWFTNLPPQLVFSLNDPSTQNFYSCLLNAQYYNRLYLIHRSNLIRMTQSSSTNPNNYKYPSWGISFQAARMISIVSKILLERDQIKYVSVMFVYILFSALMMLIYHVDSSKQVISSTAAESLFICRAVLRELAKHWPIAGVLSKLFDKYANDKIKRAIVIENSTKVAEYQEYSASQKAKKDENDLNTFYNSTDHGAGPRANSMKQNYQNGNTDSMHFSPNSQASGVSPGGGIYERTQGPLARQPNIEELVQQFKQPRAKGSDESTLSSNEKKANDRSPTSSTQSFPDISLVTESLPTNQNFFENFEPTQLFPEVSSLPPTRAQSPSFTEANQNHNHSNLGNMGPTSHIGSNVYADNHSQHQVFNDDKYPPTTPGGTFATNFIDNSFIGMNLQLGIDTDYLNDDLRSLFSLNR